MTDRYGRDGGWTRREFMAAAAGAAALPFCGLAAAGGVETRKPNIVFILADDMGWTDAGFMGDPPVETPHLDRLAEGGVVFDHAYAPAANCGPSRASMLTGQYTVRHGIYQFNPKKPHPLKSVPSRHDLDPEKVTVAEGLRRCGYRCTFIGKWHLGGAGSPAGPVRQGFDLNVGGSGNGSPRRGYFPPYEYPIVRRGPDGETVRSELREESGGRYLTDRFTDEACRCIEEAGDDPFFLFLSYHCPHSPLQAKEELLAKYQREIPGGSGLNARYAAMVENMDANIGRVLAALDDAGLRDDTLVLFFSDNGARGSDSPVPPLRGAKRDFYEGGIRVPMVVSWPPVVEPGRRCEVPVHGVDFMPTFLAAAGCPEPPDDVLDGESLLPLLRGEEALEDRPLFWHFPGYIKGSPPVGVVRKGDYKLLEFFEDGRLELYNIPEDPGEKNNLAEKEPEKAQEMHRIMLEWRERVDATMPQKNPDYEEQDAATGGNDAEG